MLSPLKLYIDVIVQKSTGVPIHVCGNIILIDDNHNYYPSYRESHIADPHNKKQKVVAIIVDPHYPLCIYVYTTHV